MPRLIVVILTLAAAMALPATALAGSGPERETATIDISDPLVFASCPGYDIVSTSVHIERTTLTWFDADGNALRENRHVYFEFALVNSVSGTEGRYVGRFSRPADFVTGAEALIGAYRQLFIDNRNVWSASGRDALTAEGELVSNGNRSLLEWEDGFCDAMA